MGGVFLAKHANGRGCSAMKRLGEKPNLSIFFLPSGSMLLREWAASLPVVVLALFQSLAVVSPKLKFVWTLNRLFFFFFCRKVFFAGVRCLIFSQRKLLKGRRNLLLSGFPANSLPVPFSFQSIFFFWKLEFVLTLFFFFFLPVCCAQQ